MENDAMLGGMVGKRRRGRPRTRRQDTLKTITRAVLRLVLPSILLQSAQPPQKL